MLSIARRPVDSPGLQSYQERFPQQFPAPKKLIGELEPTGEAKLADTVPSPNRGTLAAGERSRTPGPRRIAPVGEGYQLLERIGAGQFWRSVARRCAGRC